MFVIIEPEKIFFQLYISAINAATTKPYIVVIITSEYTSN